MPGKPTLSSAAAAQATNRHYGLPPEVFAAFLDPHMKYTSGLYLTGAETLHAAQTNKLRFIADLLAVEPGADVLDVGCGWGALTLYLAEHRECRVTSVTPSPAQAAFIAEAAAQRGLSDRICMHVGGFLEADLQPTFAAVAMVGVIEHLTDKSAAIGKVRRLLRPGGHLYVSASCYRDAAQKPVYEARPGSLHAVSVFGFTTMPILSGLLAGLEEHGLSPRSVTDLTAHYWRTIDQWRQQIAVHGALIESLEPGFADEIDRYFDGANSSWGYTARHYAVSAGTARAESPLIPRQMLRVDARRSPAV